MNITRQQLRDIIQAAGLPVGFWQLPDDSYETVSAEWAGENWSAWLDARPEELVLFSDRGGKRIRYAPKWTREVSDCDNLAIGTLAHAQVGNALASARQNITRGGLAYGILFYFAAPRPEAGFTGGGHAINWFIDHSLAVNFFEPATGLCVPLTPAEKQSGFFGLAA